MFHRSLSTRRIVERGLFELRRKQSVGTLIRHNGTNKGRAFTNGGRLVLGTTAAVVGIGALGSWWYGIGPLAAVPTLLAGSENDIRPGRISWEEFYMGAAVLAAQRSNDPVTQVGAVLVDRRKRIIGIGWNGMPTGCSDEQMPWGKERKHSYVCHAEANALALKTSDDLEEAELYTTLYPCKECAKLITQHRIKKLYYLSNKKKDKPDSKMAENLLETEEIKAIDFNVDHGDRRENPIMLDFTFMDQIAKGSTGTPGNDAGEMMPVPSVPQKKGQRPGRIDWNDFYMGMAILAAKRSNCPDIQVGAVLVDQQKRIVGVGWNGLPSGQTYRQHPEESRYQYDVQAAANAIIFKTPPDIRGTKLYTTLFPAKESTKLIIQSGVAEVHYLSDRNADNKDTKASREMFEKKRDLEVKLDEYKLGELRRTSPLKLDFAYLDRAK